MGTRALPAGRGTVRMAAQGQGQATKAEGAVADRAAAKAQGAGGEGKAATKAVKVDQTPTVTCIGLSHSRCPVSVREKLAIAQDDWPAAIQELCALTHVQEAAVLSTCNRFELYVLTKNRNQGVKEVNDWLGARADVGARDLAPYTFLLQGNDAVKHLLRVSSGLDSLVLGEGQILSQCKAALAGGQQARSEAGKGQESFGPILDALFKQAVTVGKRVRSETSISTGAVSVSSAAAELAAIELAKRRTDGVSNLAGATCCVVGAGDMARLLVKHLVAKGAKRIEVVNRTPSKAQEIIDSVIAENAEAATREIVVRPLDEMKASMADSAVVFTATGATQPIVDGADAAAMGPVGIDGVSERLWVDISVPRNMAEDIADAPGCVLYNVDDLRGVMEANAEARQDAALQAEGLVLEEVMEFVNWRKSLDAVPAIKALRTKADKIREEELEKALAKLMSSGELTKKQINLVDSLSKSIVNKLLHGPMSAVRGADGGSVEDQLAAVKALESMFSLREDGLM